MGPDNKDYRIFEYIGVPLFWGISIFVALARRGLLERIEVKDSYGIISLVLS